MALSVNGSATPTTVPLQWNISRTCSTSAAMSDADIKNVKITIDDNNPIVLTRSAAGGVFPTSYTASGLSKNTTYRFTIDVYYSTGGVDVADPISHSITATTTGSTGCTFTSSEKDENGGDWANKCDFSSNYTITTTTSRDANGDLQLSVTYTKPTDISPSKVNLGIKKNYDDSGLTEVGEMTDNNDGIYSLDIPNSVLVGKGVRAVGDSILIGVQNVVSAVAPCTEGMYCTKFVGYAVGVGCNEAYSFTFTKRKSEQNTFSMSTSAAMIRFAYRKAGSTAAYTYVAMDNDSGVHSYTLNIADFDLGTYEFVVYDKTGQTEGIKVLQAVY